MSETKQPWWRTPAVRASIARAQLREIADGTHADPDGALRQIADELDELDQPDLATELRDVAAGYDPDPDETLQRIREALTLMA